MVLGESRDAVQAPAEETCLHVAPVYQRRTPTSLRPLALRTRVPGPRVRMQALPAHCDARYPCRHTNTSGEGFETASTLARVNSMNATTDVKKAACELQSRSAMVLTITGETHLPHANDP